MKINELSNNYIFETKTIEFKKRLNLNNSFSWLKTIVAFANCDGGQLLIGVDDNRQLCGFLENEIDAEVRNINNLINSKIEPSLRFDFEYLPYVENEIKRYVIVVKIFKSKKLPVILLQDKFNAIYIRNEASTVAASSEQIRNLIISSEVITNDEVDTNIKFDEANFKKLYEVYENNTGLRLNKKTLSSINFFNSDGYLKKGSLLFSDNVNNGNTNVHCRLWDGLDKGSNVTLDNKEYSGNLFDIMDFVLIFIEKYTKSGFAKKTIGREDLLSYPKRALTEAVINAIVHRNYMITGSQIDVDIFRNRIEITSPGSLLGASFKNKETNLISIPSKRRNQLICDVFAICKLMEKSGSGFEKISEDYSEYDDKFKPHITSNNDYFVITLFDVLSKEQSIAKCDFSYLPIEGGKREKDWDILNFCLNEYKSSKEIAEMIGISRSTYFMDMYIKPLVENEYLLPLNNSKNSSNQKYKTNNEKLIFKS